MTLFKRCDSKYSSCPPYLQGLMDMNKAFEAAEQIFGIVDRKPEIDPNAAAGLRLNDVKGNVDLDAAEFSYPTRKTARVLRKLHLAIKQGEKIALVGQSGECNCKQFCDYW